LGGELDGIKGDVIDATRQCALYNGETAEVHPELQLMRPLCCGEVVKYIPLTDLIPTRQTHFKILYQVIGAGKIFKNWASRSARASFTEAPGGNKPAGEIGVAPPKLSSWNDPEAVCLE
jgi:hypothetical protein